MAIDSHDDLQYIIDLNTRELDINERNILNAYKGISTSMMAKYVFSPFTKFNYFKIGTHQLEESIKQDTSVENIYLRLLLQLSAPRFLNYNDNIEMDIKYLAKNLAQSNLSGTFKNQLIHSLLETKNDDYDLSILKSTALE